MGLNSDIMRLIDLSIEENRSYRFDNSDEYKEIYNRVDDKSIEIDEIEEEIGISIPDFYKICKAKYIWAEIGLDLTNRFNEFVLFDIKGFDVELNRILLKENKYNLNSIPFNMYKICFWLRKDKSE